MRIAILGAGGATGREAVHKALVRGWSVRALVRGAKLDWPQDPSLTVITGDALDAGAVAETLAGSDAVLCLIGTRLGQKPGRVRSESARVLVGAMQDAGVKRLVLVSTVGVAGTRAQQSWASRLFLPLIVGKERLIETGRQEAIIMASGLDWVIVRPPRLVDEAEAGAVRLGPVLRVSFSAKLGRKSLAHALLDLATASTPSRQALTCLAP